MSSILVPVDGSELSERILSLLGRLPNPAALELFLVTVVEPAPTATHHVVALAYLTGLEKRLRERGFKVQHAIQEGDPAERILATAAMLRPSLVALSTRGKGQAEGRGSVAEAVLMGCPVPLLIANPDPLPLDPGQGFARILVPLDGTPVSARILPHVEGLALQFDSEVILLNVGINDGDVRDLTPQREALEKAGVKRVEVITRVGKEAEVILAVATETSPDLMALTSHSHPETVRAFGSVAEALVRDAPCPVLVDRQDPPG